MEKPSIVNISFCFFAYKHSAGSGAEMKSDDNGVTGAFPEEVLGTRRIPGW